MFDYSLPMNGFFRRKGIIKHGFWNGIIKHGFWKGIIKHGFWNGAIKHFFWKGIIKRVISTASSKQSLFDSVYGKTLPQLKPNSFNFSKESVSKKSVIKESILRVEKRINNSGEAQ